MVMQGKCGNNRVYNVYEDDYGREGFINNYVNKIKETFKMSPAYFEINEVTEGNTVSSLISDAWLIDEDSYRQEIGRKKIIMYPEQDLIKGTIYNIPKWDNQKWMVTAIDPENLYYNNGFIRKCNYILKWIDKKTNKLCKQWCIVENKKKFTTGIDEKTAIIVGDGDFQLTLPTNEFTKRIKRDDRFLISTNTDNPQSYKVSRVDNTSNPDLILVNVMEKGAELSSYDNTVDMIPDYYKYFNNNLKIQINNPNNQIIVNKTYQLDVTVLNGTNVITPNLTFSSSDINVATVDSNGLINSKNVGNTVITVSLTDLPNVKGDMNLSVVSGSADNYMVSITGSDTLKNTQSLVYNAIATNNGVNDTSKTVIWNVSDFGKAQIVSQTGNSITLKGLSATGSIILTATLSDNPLVTISKNISLKSPF